MFLLSLFSHEYQTDKYIILISSLGIEDKFGLKSIYHFVQALATIQNSYNLYPFEKLKEPWMDFKTDQLGSSSQQMFGIIVTNVGRNSTFLARKALTIV